MDLRVIETGGSKAVSNIIKALEVTLERARQGELQAIAIAGVFKDETALNSYEPGERRTALLGALVFMQDTLLRSANAEALPEPGPTG